MSTLGEETLIQPILKSGEPALRAHCEPISEFDGEVLGIARDLLDTLKANGGYGLAAPQIGVTKRMVAVDLSAGKVRDKAQVLVNPRIISESGRVIQVEACLSLPGTLMRIPRPMKVKVEFWTPRGERVVMGAKHMMARILCHELDHLEGVLITDHKEGR